jgi:hypothetical protein
VQRLWNFVGGLSLVSILAAQSVAAPLFPDAPENHWASDALRALAAKGLVEGYPDGTFKGDRAATRYEVAMVIARLLAKMEQEHATFATKAELNDLRKLVEAYREELQALGVRVTNLEENVGRLDKRVADLERIRFYGRLHTIAVSNSLVGPTTIGTAANPGIDWSTGRLLLEGAGFTSAATLGLNADVSDDILAGAEFVAFTSQGDQGVDAYWGITPPFLLNQWTARGGVIPGQQPDNNQPFTRMVLDNFWVKHRPSDTKLTIGSFFPRYVEGFVLQGPRNPGYQKPRWLSMNGFNVNGSIAGTDSGWKYEALYTILPDLTAYNTQSMAGNIRYEFKQGMVDLNVARTVNDSHNDGVRFGSGLVPLPAVPFTGPGAPPVSTSSWLDTRTNTARTFVGPQEEVTFGLHADGQVVEDIDLRLFGEYAHSTYDPDRQGNLFSTTATGSLYRLGISAAPMERLYLSLQYQHTDPTYDPFMIAYPTSPAIPVFLPYGTYYSAYYQLHDYLNYPNNRKGFQFNGSYAWNEDQWNKNGKTSVFVNYQNLQQVKATTPAQVQTVGNIEPLFPMLQAGGAERGTVESYGAGFRHEFDNQLQLGADYFRYNLRRGGPAIDAMSLTEDVYKLSLAYPMFEDIDIRGGIWYLDYRGFSGVLNTSFTQTIPNIGLDFELSRDTRLSLDYRYLDFQQRAFAGGNYRAHQFMAEMKVDF